MHELLEDVLNKGLFVNTRQEVVTINSHTSKAQCDFLQSLIKNHNCKASIEIGFAYGTSTLAIAEAIQGNGGVHTVIDKFENEWWGGNGLDLLKQAGIEIDFREEWCYEALPALLHENKKFDFAYIDSTKQFDWILMNFFYIDKLLNDGGIIVFDDADTPGIRKALRLIVNFPNYQIAGVFPVNNKPSVYRRILSSFKVIPYSDKIFRKEILTTDYERGINAGCVALQKVGKDERIWNWHEEF